MFDVKFRSASRTTLCLLLVVAGCASGAAGDDPRVERLLASMTVPEKVGQVMVGFFQGPTLSSQQQQRIRDLHLGGLILYSSAGNIENTAQVAALVRSIQQTAVDGALVPPFVSIDQEGGIVARLTQGVTVFPGNMALGAAGSAELAARAASVTTRELRILGITMNFAPVVDVNSNPANPIIGIRSFGSSPDEVARLGTAFIDPCRSSGVLCVAKHFPGHGDTDTDSHVGLPVVLHDRARLDAVELPPFQAMVDGGVPAVMTAHVEVPSLDPSGLPATLSAPILNVLRIEMAFDGLILSDSMGMAAIAAGWGQEEAAVLSVLAGTDILLYGADKLAGPEAQDSVHAALVAAVQEGRIPLDRLDASVRRILRAKAAYGILDNPWPREGELASLGSSDNMQAAIDVARGAVTLVRNDAGLLPLAGEGSIPVIWPAEVEANMKPLLDALPRLTPVLAPLQPTADDVARVRESVRGAPAFVIGSYNLDKNTGWRDLVLALIDEKAVVIAVRSPYDLLYVPEATTYVASYSDRPAALQALAEVLGGQPPRGHLPVDLPDLHPRGWGLDGF
jgi:beta-N-acetylhexosaminidase